MRGVDVDDPAGGRVAGQNWPKAAARSLLLLVLGVVGFAIVPDRMIAYLSLHVAPRVRDLILVVWMTTYFVFMCWLFVVLQRGRDRS